MAHPLTERLAVQMWQNDGGPPTDAHGAPALPGYRAWAMAALDGLVSLSTDLFPADDTLPDQLTLLADTRVQPGPPATPQLEDRLRRAMG